MAVKQTLEDRGRRVVIRQFYDQRSVDEREEEILLEPDGDWYYTLTVNEPSSAETTDGVTEITFSDKAKQYVKTTQYGFEVI